MPLSTYLPEHMGSATAHAFRAVHRRLARGADPRLHGRYIRDRRQRHAQGVLADHLRYGQAAVHRAIRTELHDGRGKQRRQARVLGRSAQRSALGQYPPRSGRSRLPACRRYPDHPPWRSPAGLAGPAPADQLRGALRAQDLRRRLRDLRIHRNPKLAGLRARSRSGSALESDTALTCGRRGAVPSRPSLPRTFGATRPMWIVRSDLASSRPIQGLPEVLAPGSQEGPLVVSGLTICLAGRRGVARPVRRPARSLPSPIRCALWPVRALAALLGRSACPEWRDGRHQSGRKLLSLRAR